MRFKSLPVGACLSFVLLAGGCASIMRGKNQGVEFRTEPAGASVVVSSDGKQSQAYTTPAKVDLRRSERHTVLISKEGYQPVTFTLKPNWDGASLPGFILPGGSLSVAADRASGADLAFYPLPTIKLEPAAGGATRPVELHQHRAQLLTAPDYERALAEEQEYEREMRRP
jgi:hypothetical protein